MEKIDAAWKDQRIGVIKKWLNHAVFATPTASKIHLKQTDQKFVFSVFVDSRILWFTVIVGGTEHRQTRLKILSSQSKGKKEKIMTKKEMAMMNELLAAVQALTERIDVLEKANTVSRTETVKTESKKSKKSTETIVGNLIFDGKYVKTGTGFMSSKTRYAIGKAITEDFGGTKLTKGNAVYDKCHKLDKYVQVYEFKTVADCKKFMAEQQKRVVK